MILKIEEDGNIFAKLSLKEKIFGVKPQKMKELIKKNPDIRTHCTCDLILHFVRPWECPGGTGPAMVAYGKCVPKSFQRKWIPINKNKYGWLGMYEAAMLKNYYEIN